MKKQKTIDYLNENFKGLKISSFYYAEDVQRLCISLENEKGEHRGIYLKIKDFEEYFSKQQSICSSAFISHPSLDIITEKKIRRNENKTIRRSNFSKASRS